MKSKRRFAISYKEAFVLLGALVLGGCSAPWLDQPDMPFDVDTIYTPQIPDAASPNTIFIEAGDDLQFRVQEAVINAVPGTTVVLPAGTFYFIDELVIDASHLTLAGNGMNETILDFSRQESGAQGILATGDAFTVQDLTVQNTEGDGIKIEGSDGVVVRRTQIRWTRGPSVENGGYGLYPVQTRNVLLEDNIVSDASDAGIYVGQSRNIIVRRNQAIYNVAGIEIENSTFADVYENWAAFNTGGILVFDLPNLAVGGGRNSRVFDNVVYMNTTKNFAPEGAIVGLVPSGTGIMVMANDEIEVFNNLIRNHGTAGIAVVSYLIAGRTITDPTYDPFAETVHIHDNRIEMPKRIYLDGNDLNTATNFLFNFNNPDIVYDGIADAVIGGLAEGKRICIENNITHETDSQGNPKPASFGNMNLGSGNENSLGIPTGPSNNDTTPHECTYEPLLEITLEEFPPVPEPNAAYTAEQIAQLCSAETGTVNWDAYVVNCPNLADYNLYATSSDPLSELQGTGTPYDLTTPLFSDYTQKERAVFVPPGQSAVYSDLTTFEFPVGSIISKSFYSPADGSIIETRLLIHRESGWEGLPYVWQNGVATLKLGGGSKNISWTRNGEQLEWNYLIPNANQCAGCHEIGGKMIPIGPKAKWLNRSYLYASGETNQIEHWSLSGILSGAPVNLADAPRQPAWDDPADGSVEERVKAYLDMNCAHCHSGGGRARTSGLLLEAENPINTAYGLCKPPVAAGAGSGNLDYAIVPGNAEESIMHYRMNSDEPAIKMPELSKGIVHQEGVALIEEWINTLPGSCL